MSILSMSKTLFKSILHGPYTVLYPLQKKEIFQRTRGKIEIEISQCIYCGICQKRCPTSAITVDKPSTTWSIERLQCIQCSYCTEVCPKKCLSMGNQYTQPSFGNVKEVFTNARVSHNSENH